MLSAVDPALGCRQDCSIREWQEFKEILLGATSGPAQQFSLLLDTIRLLTTLSICVKYIELPTKTDFMCFWTTEILQCYELTLIYHASDL